MVNYENHSHNATYLLAILVKEDRSYQQLGTRVTEVRQDTHLKAEAQDLFSSLAL